MHEEMVWIDTIKHKRIQIENQLLKVPKHIKSKNKSKDDSRFCENTLVAMTIMCGVMMMRARNKKEEINPIPSTIRCTHDP